MPSFMFTCQVILAIIAVLIFVRINLDPETSLHATWTSPTAMEAAKLALNTSIIHVRGQVAIVTGGATGLGYDVVETLALLGFKVYVGAKSDRLGLIQQLNMRLSQNNNNYYNVILLPCDLASLNQIHAFATEVLKRESHIHLLVLNAGFMSQRFQLTEDKIESTWAVNHVAGQALFTQLLPALVATARIIVVSSSGHRLFLSMSSSNNVHVVNNFPSNGKGFYNFLVTYGASKAANVLFAHEIAKRYPNMIAYSVHPGFVRTNFAQPRPPIYTIAQWTWWDWFDTYIVAPCGKLFFTFVPLTLSPTQGAGVVLYPALLSTSVANPTLPVSGSYFIPNLSVGQPSVDFSLSSALWSKTARIIEERMIL